MNETLKDFLFKKELTKHLKENIEDKNNIVIDENYNLERKITRKRKM